MRTLKDKIVDRGHRGEHKRQSRDEDHWLELAGEDDVVRHDGLSRRVEAHQKLSSVCTLMDAKEAGDHCGDEHCDCNESAMSEKC